MLVESAEAVKPTGAVFTRRWPDPDPGAIAAISKTGFSLYDLWESSPCRFDDDLPHTEEVIDALFPGYSPFFVAGWIFSAICDSPSQRMARSPLAPVADCAQSYKRVATPLLKTDGEANILRLEQPLALHLVMEFDRDELSLDIQAALHADLARRIPLVAAVFSGHEPLHGWYFVYGWLSGGSA